VELNACDSDSLIFFLLILLIPSSFYFTNSYAVFRIRSFGPILTIHFFFFFFYFVLSLSLTPINFIFAQDKIHAIHMYRRFFDPSHLIRRGANFFLRTPCFVYFFRLIFSSRF
jgi:hypothetical protein